jgi:hypothetical protein
LDVMSISAAADFFTMTMQRGQPALPLDDSPVAMQLMADGVPLALLVDLALPVGLDFDPSSAPSESER